MSGQIKTFNAEQVRRSVEPLDRKRRIALLLSLAERFYPSYVRFSASYGWGNPIVLARAMDEGWEAFEGRRPIEAIQSTEDAVLDVCPDTEIFEGADVPLALAACAIVVYLIRFMRTGDLSCLVQATQSAADAVESHAGWLLFPNYSGVDTSEMWDQQRAHAVVQSELSSLEEDLVFLQGLRCLDEEALTLVRDRFRKHT